MVVYKFINKKIVGLCICGALLSTKGEPKNMKVQLRAPKLIKNKSQQIMVETECYVRLCLCGVCYLVQPVPDGNNYSFRCIFCDCFHSILSKAGQCINCILELNGITDVYGLEDSLKESEDHMGITRSEFLDGFLKGILIGCPDLIYTEST